MLSVSYANQNIFLKKDFLNNPQATIKAVNNVICAIDESTVITIEGTGVQLLIFFRTP